MATPGRSGYRLLISRAGDWTGRFIDDPRVVYVVTGSGIGPCLGQILAARVPARLVWSTRDPRAAGSLSNVARFAMSYAG